MLSYYKNEAEYTKGKEMLGAVELVGATLFLKTVIKDKVYRFTVRSKGRELKLRAANVTDYEAWCEAMKPIVNIADEDARESFIDAGNDDWSENDDSDEEGAGASAPPPGQPQGYQGYLEKKSGGKVRPC